MDALGDAATTHRIRKRGNCTLRNEIRSRGGKGRVVMICKDAREGKVIRVESDASVGRGEEREERETRVKERREGRETEGIKESAFDMINRRKKRSCDGIHEAWEV